MGRTYINCAMAADPVLPPDLFLDAMYPMPGCLVVAMGSYAASGLSIVVSEGDTPDYGVVVSADPSVPLVRGDRVFVMPDHGKHMAGFSVAGRKLGCEVRLFGRAATIGGGATTVPWWRSVPVRLTIGDMSEKAVHATWDNVIIDRGEVITESEGGILYTKDSSYRPTKGVVVSVGEYARRKYPHLKPGAVVYYLANAMVPLKNLKLGDEYRNYGVIPSDGILCEVAE